MRLFLTLPFVVFIVATSCDQSKSAKRSQSPTPEESSFQLTPQMPAATSSTPRIDACEFKGVKVYCLPGTICSNDKFKPICVEKPKDDPKCPLTDTSARTQACWRDGVFLGCCMFSEDCAVDSRTGGLSCYQRSIDQECDEDLGNYWCGGGEGGRGHNAATCCKKNQLCRNIPGHLQPPECVNAPTCARGQNICVGTKLGANPICCPGSPLGVCGATADGSPTCVTQPDQGNSWCGQQILHCLATTNKSPDQCVQEVLRIHPTCKPAVKPADTAPAQ